MAECREEPDSKGAAIPADDGPPRRPAVLERAMVKKALPDFEPRPHSVDNESYFMRAPSPGKGDASSRRKRQFFIRRFDGSRSLTSFCVASMPVTGRPPKLDCKRHGKAILNLVEHPATE